MKKMLALILLMSLTTVSCNKSGEGSSSGESPQSVTSPTISDSGDANSDNTSTGTENTGSDTTSTESNVPSATSTLPALALSFETNVDLLSGFTQTQEDKYNDAVALVKKVVATEAFRTQVLNHIYNGVKQFADNKGLTNSQIYQSVLDAAETLQPAKNNIMDVGVKLYYANNSVVGYTNGSITYINVNTKFFNGYDINQVAGNLFHEWLHKLGYGHDYTATTKRPYSVPYAIGYIIREIGKNFL